MWLSGFELLSEIYSTSSTTGTALDRNNTIDIKKKPSTSALQVFDTTEWSWQSRLASLSVHSKSGNILGQFMVDFKVIIVCLSSSCSIPPVPVYEDELVSWLTISSSYTHASSISYHPIPPIFGASGSSSDTLGIAHSSTTAIQNPSPSQTNVYVNHFLLYLSLAALLSLLPGVKLFKFLRTLAAQIQPNYLYWSNVIKTPTTPYTSDTTGIRNWNWQVLF